jgi:hypothetical protein
MGNNVDKAVAVGVIHVDMVSVEDLAQFAARYPSVTIDYQRLGNAITLIVDGEIFYRKVLAIGEPITVPADPSKESTAQYHFSFEGWSLDGTTVSEIPSVMGDRSLTYTAVFTEVLRTYTIRFYNESIMLQAIMVAYGDLPVYTGSEPTKESSDTATYKFSGWSPEIAVVTGNADYYAQFAEVRSLEQHSWAEISAISAEGTGANYFSVGDTKSVAIKGTVGTLDLDTTLYVYIIGFDHNEEFEGKGIHFGMFKNADGKDLCLVDSKYTQRFSDGTMCFNLSHWGASSSGGWAGCDMRYDILGSTDTAPSGYGAYPMPGRVGYDPSATCASIPVVNTLMAALPAVLRAVMKPMTKYTDNVGGSGDTAEKVTASVDYLPLLAEYEIAGSQIKASSAEQNYQAQYSYYAATSNKSRYSHSSNNSLVQWWERSAVNGGGAFCYVHATGALNFSAAPNYDMGIAPIFKV